MNTGNIIISAIRILRNKGLTALLPALGLILCSCSEEFLPGTDASDNARTEITLSLDTDVPFGDFRTRGTDAMGNNDVATLWVGVYDIQTGNRVGAQHFSYPSSPVTLPVLYYDNHPEVVIVGVANYGGITDWDGASVSELLDGALTWNSFMDINVKAPLVDGAPVVDTDSPQIMMGMVTTEESGRAFCKKADSGAVEMPKGSECVINLSPNSLYGGMIKTIAGKKLYLQRLSSQVNVNIIAGNNAEVTDVSYRRCNIPKAVFLAERPTYIGNFSKWGEFSEGTSNFADKQMQVADGNVITADCYYSDDDAEWIRAGRDNSFSFAHYENRHFGGGTNPAHDAREKFKENSNVLVALQSAYNNYASYFVVKMTILDRGTNRSAQVKYVIHEGNINNQSGEQEYSNERARDFSAFRNTVYNYNITVNGVDYITYNVSSNPQHHDAASGTIWEADIKTGTYNTVTINVDANTLFRFYIGQGKDTAPIDYLDGNVPDGIGGMYWPAIDENTVRGNIPSDISSRFTIRRGNNRGQEISLQQFINEVRSSGGTYYITFSPPYTQEQWDPDAYKMGLYYYLPSEKSNLSGQDKDECTTYSGKKFHVIEWKPSAKQPTKLGALSTYNLPTATVSYTSNEYVTLNFSTAHDNSGNKSNGTYGTDYVYVLTVNGHNYNIGNNKSITVPLADFGSGTSYSVHAEALNTRYYSNSDETSQNITVNNINWNFYTDDFAKWFSGHFYTQSGRYTAPQDLDKVWTDGLHVCLLKGKQIARLYEDPPYLYFNNTGDGNGLKFRVYKNCKITVSTYLKDGGRTVYINGATPGYFTPQNTNWIDTNSNNNVYLDEGEHYKDISIYYNGGGGYFYSVSVTN